LADATKAGVPRMKRFLCLLFAFCLLAPVALAEAADIAMEASSLTGEQYYPAGSNAETAAYVFRYAYPQFSGQANGIPEINAYYASLASDMVSTVMPETVAGMDDLPAQGSPPYYTQISYRITANTSDYVSVLLTSQQFSGNNEEEDWTANVFARSGVYTGQTVSLSQAMGLEQEDGVNGDSYAAELAYRLIWQIILQEQSTQRREYFPELTQADLEKVFSPESDFYLDEDGNIVFFIQSGEIASEVEGILTYPFSIAELLSAVSK